MEHVAIDIGGRESQICRRAADGTILEETRVVTRDLGQWFSSRAPARIILETCAEAFSLADQAMAAGHEVRVVPATLVASLGVGSRKTKSDRRDARILSEASCRIELPGVHIPSAEARARKTMLSMRDGLVQSRTMLINTVRGWLRTIGARCRSGAPETFPERVREALGATPLPPHLDRQLEVIATLSAQILASERELAAIAKKDETCPRLMSVPGVGPVTALAFVATLDDIGRFETAHKLESYLGLTPGEHSSSDRQRRTGITKAGPSRTRWLLVQAAWAVLRTKPDDPIAAWAAEVKKRRGKAVATVAVARKLAGILFALWRDGTLYEPSQAAKPLQVLPQRTEAPIT